MTRLLSLWDVPPYLEPITSLMGWLGWVFLFEIAIVALIRWRQYQACVERRVLLYVMLVVLVPLTSLFLGVRFSSGVALPDPVIPETPHSAAAGWDWPSFARLLNAMQGRFGWRASWGGGAPSSC